LTGRRGDEADEKGDAAKTSRDTQGSLHGIQGVHPTEPTACHVVLRRARPVSHEAKFSAHHSAVCRVKMHSARELLATGAIRKIARRASGARRTASPCIHLRIQRRFRARTNDQRIHQRPPAAHQCVKRHVAGDQMGHTGHGEINLRSEPDAGVRAGRRNATSAPRSNRP
jgi:hypothetical protein